MSKRDGHDERAEALLSALGQMGRDIRRENAELERLSAGSAPSRSMEDVDSRLVAAARPLPEDVQKRILASVPARPAKVVSMNRWRRVMAIAAPLCAAAALLLFVTSRGGEHALPAYSMEIVGSQSTMRDAPTKPNTEGVARLGDEAPLVVVARPVSRPEGPIEAFAFGKKGGAWSPIPADIRVAEEGSARLQLTAPSLRDVDELRIVVSPRGTSADDARQRAERGDALSVRLEHTRSAR